MITAQRPDDDVTADDWFRDSVECELAEMFSDQIRCTEELRRMEEDGEVDLATVLGFLIAHSDSSHIVARSLEDLRDRVFDANRHRAERRVLAQWIGASYDEI